MQGDFFRPPTPDFSEILLHRNRAPKTIIVGCGRRKRTNPDFAENLYLSNRFRLSLEIAKDLGSQVFVLSGKHGLIKGRAKIQPYELDLSEESDEYKSKWREQVSSQFRDIQRPVSILASHEYFDFSWLTESDLKCTKLCLENVSGTHLREWLGAAKRFSIRHRDVSLLYSEVNKARHSGRTFEFGNLSNVSLPEKGVYLFINPTEPSIDKNSGRIVRIGTHAVSEGSKATLRNRLTNHRGTLNGLGNHRGSIFRLHVGNAILQRENLFHEFPQWGLGQNASKGVRDSEQNLEQLVSTYLSKLEVAIIKAEDKASKNSVRAKVETQLISLFTEDFGSVDRASPNWLGSHSKLEKINTTGLWNLRDVGGRYYPTRKGSVSYIINNNMMDF